MFRAHLQAQVKIDPFCCPPNHRTMQAKQYQGLWYLLDSRDNKLYAFEKIPSQQPLWLGHLNPQTNTPVLRADWKEAYEAKLQEYRQTEKPRSRVPQAST